jgi:hypothetical protein
MSWNIKEIIEMTQVTRFFETSVTIYPAVRCHIQDDRNPGLHDHPLYLIYFMYFNVKYSLRMSATLTVTNEANQMKLNMLIALQTFFGIV